MQNSCRTCMIQFSQTHTGENSEKQSIFEVPYNCKNATTIMELLQEVHPQIKVDRKDNLPTLMCTECIQNLLVSHTFLETYKNADKQFREMLKEANDNDSKDNFEMIFEIGHTEEDFKDKKLNDDNECSSNVYKITEITATEGILKKEESEHDSSESEDEISDESDEQNMENSSSDSSDSDWATNESSPKEDLHNTSMQKQRRAIPNKIMLDEKELIKLPEQNEDGTVPCQECDAVLNSITLWREHMRQHRLGNIPTIKRQKKSNKTIRTSVRKKYQCEYCGKGFYVSSNYKTHLRIHTGEQPYLCIECGKSFKSLGNLKNHMLRHKGEKTYECPHCPKKFVCSSGLYKHKNVHTKEKPFVCDTCGSAFRLKYDLTKHYMNHKGIKKYKCEYCEMRFLTSEKQRRHMRTHTGEKPYRCKYCERAFAQSNDYIKHLRQHLGDNVYQCELCPLRFKMVRDLRVHFVTHKDEDEETRARNLVARQEEQRKMDINLGVVSVEK